MQESLERVMRIGIAGATGLIGTELVQNFEAEGHSLLLLTRSTAAAAGGHQVSVWDPKNGKLDPEDLAGLDVIINLAGANLAARWSKARKKEIVESRVLSTKLLAETLASLKSPPKLFMVASAIGYYGNRDPEEQVDETSSSGKGFLADVCRQWEEAAQPAAQAGIRVVNLRFGMVLSESGGALAKMLPLFRKGLGGKAGDGSQMISWIDLREVYPIVRHLIDYQELTGPINLVAPAALTNQEFTRVLADTLGRSAPMTAKPFMLKIAYGEMAEEVLLGGANVYPRKLLESGYRFRHENLGDSLREILGLV